MEIIKYNAMGEEVKAKDPTYLTLHMIRMQQKNIRVNDPADNLGSILYADSFYQMAGQSLNITKNVPNLLSFYTSYKHYQNCTTHWFTDKGLKCERFGQRVFSLTDLEGLYPVKQKYSDILPNVVLAGKLVVYENAIIFEDTSLHNFVIDLKDIEKVSFYTSKDTWADIQVRDTSSFPLNTIADGRIIINIKNNFYSKNMNLLCEAIGEERIEKFAENFETKSELFQAIEWKNYRLQRSTKNQTVYTGYLDFEIFREEYTMFMEFAMISMFNEIRGKSFVSYSQFAKIWETAQTATRDLAEPSDKTKLILVSGIPGSGKSTFGLYLSKLLNIENIRTSTYIMPVSASTKFSSEEFLKGLFAHVSNNPTPTVIGVIPSYHHLKKAIFEFKKEDQFNDTFELEYVITRVSAKNFYRHKNRNTYQFLLENCLKGICDAVIFEKQTGVDLNEFQTMRKQLCEVNDDQNILNVTGRTFQWRDLEQILTRKHNKFSLLYGKYFYGFEKEGKSAYYLENAASGAYFNYKTPLREDLLGKGIHNVFNNPVEDFRELVPEEEKRCEFPSTVESTDAESDNKENISSHEETGSERLQRRKKKQQEFEKKQIQADLEQEQLLIAEMKKIKKAMKGNSIILERLKGMFLVEGKEEECDYRLISSFNEVKLKSCKNSENRLLPEELGFLVYGKNVTPEKFKNLLNAFRSQLKSLYTLRTPESVTKKEIEMLQEKYFGEHMPDNFYHDGYSYVDDRGERQLEHPNIKKLIEIFIDEENSKIADYNRSVQKEWKQDAEKYS